MWNKIFQLRPSFLHLLKSRNGISQSLSSGVCRSGDGHSRVVARRGSHGDVLSRGGAAEVTSRRWQICEESESDWRSHAAAIARSVDLIKARSQVQNPPFSCLNCLSFSRYCSSNDFKF